MADSAAASARAAASCTPPSAAPCRRSPTRTPPIPSPSPFGAPVTAGAIVLAVILAIGAALVAGSLGGWRISQLRPAAGQLLRRRPHRLAGRRLRVAGRAGGTRDRAVLRGQAFLRWRGFRGPHRAG